MDLKWKFECLSEIGYFKYFFQPETKDFSPMLFWIYILLQFVTMF